MGDIPFLDEKYLHYYKKDLRFKKTILFKNIRETLILEFTSLLNGNRDFYGKRGGMRHNSKEFKNKIDEIKLFMNKLVISIQINMFYLKNIDNYVYGELDRLEHLFNAILDHEIIPRKKIPIGVTVLLKATKKNIFQ